MKNTFKGLSVEQAIAKREELKKTLMEARFKAVVGHLENPLIKRTLRRQIAQLNTIIGKA